MKKLFPLNLLLFVSIFTAGIFFIPEMNILVAKKSSAEKKKYAHYETMLTKLDLKTFDQKKKIVGKELGKGVVVLNFWASWCRPCLEEFPSLVKFRSKFDNKDVKVIALNSDEEDIKKSVGKIIKKYDLNFDVALDSEGQVTDAFNISAIPVSIIYNNGKVVEVSNGAKDFYSEEFIEQIKTFIKKK